MNLKLGVDASQERNETLKNRKASAGAKPCADVATGCELLVIHMEKPRAAVNRGPGDLIYALQVGLSDAA